jgi:hypothetical protein
MDPKNLRLLRINIFYVIFSSNHNFIYAILRDLFQTWVLLFNTDVDCILLAEAGKAASSRIDDARNGLPCSISNKREIVPDFLAISNPKR